MSINNENEKEYSPDTENKQEETSGLYHYTSQTVPAQSQETVHEPAPGAARPSAQQPPQPQQTYRPQPTGNVDYSAYSYPGATQNQSSGRPGYNPGYNGAYPGSYNAPPVYTGTTPQKPPKRKHSGGKVALIALALVIALAGGAVGGGFIASAVMHSSDSTTQEQNDAQAPEQSVTEFGADDGQTNDSDTSDRSAITSRTIEVTTNSPTTEMTPQTVYENYVNAVVAISNEGTTTNVFGQTSATASSGSGMIISKDGYILTNNHVTENAQTLTVTMTDGSEYPAEIIGADSENDVALIKIDATDLPTVSIGNSDDIIVGEQVCAIGNPLGELTNTLTVGYVSALDREIYESSSAVISMFQTDCAINSGNSGGPIFDMNGNVIGITTAKYSTASMMSSASIEGIGFCIPINDAMDIVNDLLEYGYVRGRASLGITCMNISSTVTQYYNLPTGVYVSSVNPGSAAEQTGLKEGDIILSLDGQETQTVSSLKMLLKNYTPGNTLPMEVYRGETGQIESMTITLDESGSTTAPQTPTNGQG